MKTPNKLREQLNAYSKAGFEARTIEPRRGSHWLVTFDKVGPMILTTNLGDPRAIKNNISELRRREARLDEAPAAATLRVERRAH